MHSSKVDVGLFICRWKGSTCSAIYFRLIVEWMDACGLWISFDALWRCINFRSWRHALAALKFATATTATTLCFMAALTAAVAYSSEHLVELVVCIRRSHVSTAPCSSRGALNHLCSVEPRHHVMLAGVVLGPRPTTHHAAYMHVRLFNYLRLSLALGARCNAWLTRDHMRRQRNRLPTGCRHIRFLKKIFIYK